MTNGPYYNIENLQQVLCTVINEPVHTHTHTHTQLAFEGGGAALAFNYVNATSGTEGGAKGVIL